MSTTANPCRCGSTNLRPKWDSSSGLGWVHCDSCGNISTPVQLSQGREKIIEQWNKDNEKKEQA